MEILHNKINLINKGIFADYNFNIYLYYEKGFISCKHGLIIN